jgi:hypothetical protein
MIGVKYAFSPFPLAYSLEELDMWHRVGFVAVATAMAEGW